MAEYIFTSKLFKGQILFGFDEQDTLVKFINEAELTDEQIKYLTHNFPFTLSDLHKILGKSGKIEELIDVTFENFWERYDKKVNKKRCEQLWFKLTEADRQVCLSKIQRYKNYCKMNNRITKDPDTYLRNRSWEDEL